MAGGPHQRPFDVGPIGSDGGRIYIQNGQLHRIPPYGPVLQIMQQLAAHAEASTIRDVGLRILTQATALTELMHHAGEAFRALDPIRAPSVLPAGSFSGRIPRA